MSTVPVSPFQTDPPSIMRLLYSVVVALVLAAVVLIAVVLPAEYAIDYTGVGRMLGLTPMSQIAPTRKIVLDDVLVGNDALMASKVADVGVPLTLPNPAVHQAQSQPAKSETLTISLPADAETEIKAVLPKGKVILYSWKVDHDAIYVDFHGHDPAWENKSAFVRYQEKDGSAGAQGSLVAPFSGEHGWYLLNTNGFPVVVTLTVSGYYDKLINYGVRQQ